MNATVSGYVLKLARQSTALTQEKFAEVMQVDVNTIQGWESGRRPLSAITAGEFLRLCGRLSRLGAPASTGRHLREAIEADQVLSTGIAAADSWVDPDHHPLAASVHRWTITNLILWPFVGKTPQHLHDFAPRTARRGPVARGPELTPEQRERFLDHLLTVAERAAADDEALLRRQAVYLLGFDPRPKSVDWLRADWHRAGRRQPRQGNITELLEARSASVALALAGDSTYLYDFVDHMADEPAEIANLNYWAYWIGEISDEQSNDNFMLDADIHSWSGTRMLHHLLRRLDPNTPHRPLNLATLHALIASRPSLLSEPSGNRTALAAVLERLASTDSLTRTEQAHLASLHYAMHTTSR